MQNIYRILETENFAPMDVVTRSFHRLVMIHHPDRGGDQEKMKIINSAYDVLKRYKASYDAALRAFLNPVPVFVEEIEIVINPNMADMFTSATGWYRTANV